MTREQYARLTPEEKRIKVAEFCGWVPNDTCGGKDSGWYNNSEPYATDIRLNGCPMVEDLPDYLNDLNACHEMEKQIVGIKVETYRNHLIGIMDGAYAHRCLYHATAEQRCEAFVLTMEDSDD